MKSVLIIDDAPETAVAITAALRPADINCVQSSSCKETLKSIDQNHFDLLILDLSLPDGNGLDLMNQLHQDSNLKNIPIFILSSTTDVSAKISAFALGAEDYITKPFNLLELRARVEAKLRKTETTSARLETIESPPFILDVPKQKLYIQGLNTPIALTSIEFRIMALLTRRREVIFTRAQILDLVWGNDTHISDRTVDTHIYTLRRKMGPYGVIIESIPGQGYRMTPKAELAH